MPPYARLKVKFVVGPTCKIPLNSKELFGNKANLRCAKYRIYVNLWVWRYIIRSCLNWIHHKSQTSPTWLFPGDPWAVPLEKTYFCRHQIHPYCIWWYMMCRSDMFVMVLRWRFSFFLRIPEKTIATLNVCNGMWAKIMKWSSSSWWFSTTHLKDMGELL